METEHTPRLTIGIPTFGRDTVLIETLQHPPHLPNFPYPPHCLAFPPGDVRTMEFLNFLIILVVAWLVWRRPEREKLAFRLLVASCVIMAVLFLIGTHTSLIPGVNL